MVKKVKNVKKGHQVPAYDPNAPPLVAALPMTAHDPLPAPPPMFSDVKYDEIKGSNGSNNNDNNGNNKTRRTKKTTILVLIVSRIHIQFMMNQKWRNYIQ